jgi:hypothetical protein
VPDPPRYRLEFVAGPSDVPPVHRLRSLLKAAWRSWRLRCVRCEEIAPGEEVPAMTGFTDGPAAGQTLYLRRAPVYLRVAVGPKVQVDALDQLDDEPADGEQLHAYRKVSDDGTAHVDSRDAKTGRRIGRWYACATYAVADPQPDQDTMRSRDAWRGWCQQQAARKGAPDAPTDTPPAP